MSSARLRHLFYIQGLVMTGQGISQTLAAAGMTKPSLEVGVTTLVIGGLLWFYGSRKG